MLLIYLFQVWMLLPDVVYLIFVLCLLNIMFCLHRCYDADCIINSVIFPLCTDVMVLGIMILIAQMLQCRIIICLLSVLGWIVITHPIGVQVVFPNVSV